jgi:hypothetical protein
VVFDVDGVVLVVVIVFMVVAVAVAVASPASGINSKVAGMRFEELLL